MMLLEGISVDSSWGINIGIILKKTLHNIEMAAADAAWRALP